MAKFEVALEGMKRGEYWRREVSGIHFGMKVIDGLFMSMEEDELELDYSDIVADDWCKCDNDERGIDIDQLKIPFSQEMADLAKRVEELEKKANQVQIAPYVPMQPPIQWPTYGGEYCQRCGQYAQSGHTCIRWTWCTTDSKMK